MRFPFAHLHNLWQIDRQSITTEISSCPPMQDTYSAAETEGATQLLLVSDEVVSKVVLRVLAPHPGVPGEGDTRRRGRVPRARPLAASAVLTRRRSLL